MGQLEPFGPIRVARAAGPLSRPRPVGAEARRAGADVADEEAVA